MRYFGGFQMMSNRSKSWALIGRSLLGLMLLTGLPSVAISAKSSKSDDLGAYLAVSGNSSINPEDFIRPFDSMRQRQNMPPEVAGLFQGMLGIMSGAAKGQDPQTIREKSHVLLQGLRPLMEKSDLPPEAAEILNSFQSLMQKVPNNRSVN